METATKMPQGIIIKASWKGIISDCILMLFLVGFFTIFKKIPEILSTKIVITPTRISGFTGVAKRRSLDEPIKQISSVQVEQNPLAQMCNYGTLIISTQSGRIAFRYISNPKEVKELIIWELLRKADMNFTEFVAISSAETVANRNRNKTVARPKVKYHSFLLWLFFGWIVLWIPCIYYFLSDKHKFKFL